MRPHVARVHMPPFEPETGRDGCVRVAIDPARVVLREGGVPILLDYMDEADLLDRPAMMNHQFRRPRPPLPQMAQICR